MAITATKITSTKVLKGVSPSSKALPVISNDINPIIDDLTMLDAKLIENRTASPINATATATAAQIATGYITSTSVGATSITLPTAALLSAQLGAVAGSSFDFIVSNISGSSVVTVIVGSGITVLPATLAIIGTDVLTVNIASVGLFKLVFSSTSVAKIIRIA